jgi:GT2 family glycosyltransferase
MLVVTLIINFNSASELLEVANQLEREVVLPAGFENKLIIVENGSTKTGEWEKLQLLKKYPDAILLKSPRNLGFTGGNILAYERAKELNPDYILLLNPDTVVDKNFLVELLDARADMVSPKIYFAPGFETHPERYKRADLGRVIWYGGGIIDWDNVVGYHKNVDAADAGTEVALGPTDFCTGCCLLVRREVLDKIGFLDNHYFMNLEDLDLSVRAQRAGFATIYAPKAVIWHKNAISKGGPGSKVEDYWQTRNRLIFAFRYAPWKTRLLLLKQLLSSGDPNRLRAIWSALIS